MFSKFHSTFLLEAFLTLVRVVDMALVLRLYSPSLSPNRQEAKSCWSVERPSPFYTVVCRSFNARSVIPGYFDVSSLEALSIK